MDGKTDEILVREARAGDARALDRLLRRHEARVLRVLRLLGVAADDREDVAQEVFVRVFRHLGGYRTGHSFAGWIYRISVNATHDHRRRMRRRRGEETAWEDHYEEAADPAPGPADLADRADRQRRLERALDVLSERERAVFVLCELEDQETRTVARGLGISSITVRRHLGRARKRLRAALSDPPKEKSPDG